MKLGPLQFGLRALFVVLGLILWSVVVWFFGPYLGLGSSQPLASVSGRLIVIVLSLLIALGIWFFGRWRSAKKTQALAQGLADQDGDERQQAERDELRFKFEEAVNTLKSSKGNQRGLYELPWYAIVGPPGSGKSTLLLNSGLEFPLADKFGREAVRGVGGTRRCDWWFTSGAVFLDTAGRFTTQDSDAVADKVGWQEFLKLLVRFRPKRPLNGVIVAISASDLLALTDAQLEELAATVKRRIDELQKETGVVVPVYMVLTKLDLIAGFAEFFSDMDRDQRAQVWGMTFPAEKSIAGEAADEFETEFDLLCQSLNSRWIERAHREHDDRRRAALFAFPSQINALRPIVSRFVHDAMSAGGYGQSIVLRGVYLTSGTQEGTPIDRMLGALGRAFGIDAAPARGAAAQVRTFFVERLLRDVLIPESGLAGLHPKMARRRRNMRLLAWGGAIGVTVLAIGLLAVSYFKNRQYLEDIEVAVAAVPEGASGSSEPLRQIGAQLDALSLVTQVAGRREDDVPLSMRWGLSQVQATRASGEDAYFRALSSQLLPVFANHLRTRLIETSAEPEMLYEYLRAYLMLAEPKRIEPGFLAAIGQIEWSRVVPDDSDLRKNLQRHFANLVSRKEGFPPFAMDTRVVKASRQALLRASLARLAYGRLQGLYATQDWPPVILEEAIGMGAGEVLVRKSGISLDAEAINALYTQEVFQSVVSGGAAEVVKALTEDDWVFGDSSKRMPSAGFLEREVIEVYEQDYIAQWEVLLDDIQLRDTPSLGHLKEQLYYLASSTSPMKTLLDLVTEHTRIKIPDPADDPSVGLDAKRIESDLRRGVEGNRLGRLLSIKSGGRAGGGKAPPGESITLRFEPFHKLAGNRSGIAPIDGVLELLERYRSRLSGMSADGGVSQAVRSNAADLVSAIEAEAKRWPEPVAGWLRQTVGTGTDLAAGLVRSELASSFTESVGREASKLCKQRYPFAANAKNAIAVQDFSRLFGHGGLYDEYFNGQLAALVDTSRRHWRWRPGPGGKAPGSASLLREVQAALAIRDAFFPDGAEMTQLRFVVQLVSDDVDHVNLRMGRQDATLSPKAAPRTELEWPAGGVGGLKLEVNFVDGRRETAEWSGQWAFFKILDDAGKLDEQAGQVEVSLKLSGGSKLDLRVLPLSLRNPFTQPVIRSFPCD